MTFERAVDIVRRANAPLPPEHSVVFRAAVGVAVVTGVAACSAVGEVSRVPALLAVVAISIGMTFSYVTRNRPLPWVKVGLALAVLAVFTRFVVSILAAAGSGNLSSIAAPLAGLFVWVQVLHALDVPARRDLLFSLAASGASVAVAGAQALDASFAPYLAIWFVAAVTSLVLSWRSLSHTTGGHPASVVLATSLVCTVLAALVVAALPATSAVPGLKLPASLSSHVSLANPGGLAGGTSGAEPARPGLPGERIAIGGYDGFAGPLNTGLRGPLSNQIIFHVRANRPAYFLGMTYDRWNGTSWLEPAGPRITRALVGGSPFAVGVPLATAATGPSIAVPSADNVQTFYVEAPMPNLVLGASEPEQVWFPDRTLYVDAADSSIRTAVAITPGTIYTVISADTAQSPVVLGSDRTAFADLPAPVRQRLAVDLALPRPYASVRALAQSIVTRAHAATLYEKVAALESWMAHNVEYSTQIPPLAPGQDAVVSFLFGTRVGYCEQISTALAVMLRTIGVPAREATGYVPGSFNPLTDLFDVRASDAHAWVQVWFPRYGWQSFDPTADVPLATPSPGAALFHDIRLALDRIPGLPVGASAGGLVVLGACYLALRRRPRDFVEAVRRDLERAAGGRGAARRPSETLAELAARLVAAAPPAVRSARAEELRLVVDIVGRAAYGGRVTPADERRRAREIARGLCARRTRRDEHAIPLRLRR